MERKQEYGKAPLGRMSLADGLRRSSRELNCKPRVGTIFVQG